MISLQVTSLILIVAVVLAALLWQWYRSHIFKRASGLARRVFPVWAAQGPFDSGEKSATAMRYAYLAVFGPEEAERMGMVEAIAKHAAAYDSNPAAWEQNRQQAILSASSETEEFVTIAKGLAAMDSLNKDILESGGHKLELARQSDGSLDIAYKKIWSDEAIEEKKQQDNEAIVSGIGKGLLNDTSEEARALVAFLADIYKANTGEEAISASAIGRAWLACFTMKNEYPDSDPTQEFERLNEAHQANLESTEDTLPWSNNPSAHEAHLMRRHNNPYFPESRRSVSHEDLKEEKKKDKDDYILCQRRLEELGQEIEALPQTATSGDLLALRERIDGLIFFSMGVGGPATEIASKADQLREAVISDLRSAFVGDEETLSNIEKADTYHKDNARKFYIPVIAQMRRENSPILKEETIATVLSEDPSSIAIFINCLPEDSRALIEVEGLKMLQEALDNGHIDPQCEEKIFALRGEWPIEKT